MIESITVPLDAFDLDGFIKGYSDFCRKWSGDESVASFVTGIREYDQIPSNFLDGEVVDELGAIHDSLMDGIKVFFMMHEPAADDRFLCIDGKKRKSNDLDINLEDGYGFLVEVEGDRISLHPALYDGTTGRPSLTLQGTCGILEEPMSEFVRKFVAS